LHLQANCEYSLASARGTRQGNFSSSAAGIRGSRSERLLLHPVRNAFHANNALRDCLEVESSCSILRLRFAFSAEAAGIGFMAYRRKLKPALMAA
jgi:hypothetical protein